MPECRICTGAYPALNTKCHTLCSWEHPLDSYFLDIVKRIHEASV